MQRSFAGKLAVITGGASGIGAETARHLREAGAEVRIGDLRAEGAAKLDVCDRAAVTRFFEGLPRAPDVLITCAGGAKRAAALDVDEALLNETLQLNLGGFWRCAQEAARRAIAEKKPLAIIHVASSLHRGPAPQLSHFAAAKAASVTMVRCLAQEWAAHSIRVNAVVPGPIETPATTPLWDARPGHRDMLRQSLPLGRIGTVSDVVPAIVWLASPDAAWTTGSIFTVDGGLDVAP
ncbi:MAG: SDR family oxidoreductase [Rhodospirillaceae bacterium]|nr:SDR family oxidoreductase [Rhodospirillaceae bacterium]